MAEPVAAAFTVWLLAEAAGYYRPMAEGGAAERELAGIAMPFDFALHDFTGVAPADNPLFATALFLAGLGLYVLPCRPWEKVPAVQRPYQAATRNPVVLERWWTRWPNANPAVATGRLLADRSRLIVIDYDDRSSLDKALEAGWTATVRTRTRRGEHHYLRWTAETTPKTRQSNSRRLPGVDLKAGGTHVLAPWSRFRSPADGEVYVYEPIGWGPGCLDGLPAVPAAVEAMMLPARAKPSDEPEPSWADIHLALRPAGGRDRSSWLNETREGHRHQAIYSLCLQGQRTGRPWDEVSEEIRRSPVSARLADERDPDAWLAYLWDRAGVEVLTGASGLAPAQAVVLPPSHAAALDELDRHRAAAVEGGELTRNRDAVLQAHIAAARTRGLNYYLATRMIKETTGLSLGTVSNINDWLIDRGWLHRMGRPFSRMNQHRQADYWALLLDGYALITLDHPMYTDPQWPKSRGTGVLTLYDFGQR